MSTKRGLGKGFGSLLPDDFDSSVLIDRGERIQKIAISGIVADPKQPRRHFDSAAISELADSIKRYGVLQPLVVTNLEASGNYQIIAGERRYRAAKKAGLTHVPALVRSMKELERLEVGLVENMQRVDLSPMEQAISIARLHEQFSMDLHTIATRLGKAYTTVSNIVRLLQLPDFAREALDRGQISEGHARAVLSLKDQSSVQKQLVNHIVKDGWSVRQAENFVKALKGKEVVDTPKKSVKKSAYSTSERHIAEKFAASKVTILSTSRSHSVNVKFKTDQELADFLKHLA